VAAENIGMNGGEIGFTLLKLACIDCKEVTGKELGGDIGHKEGGKGNIKWKDRFDAIGHVKGDIAS
jgi:hypothetical protein